MTSYKISLHNIIGPSGSFIPNESGLGDILVHLKKLGKIEIIIDNTKNHSYTPSNKRDALLFFNFISNLAVDNEKSYRSTVRLIGYKRDNFIVDENIVYLLCAVFLVVFTYLII
jgi:hypothetical protein